MPEELGSIRKIEIVDDIDKDQGHERFATCVGTCHIAYRPLL
jgi:hypothetical protein